MINSIGIVLCIKKLIHHKIVIFDQQYGHVECIINNNHVSVGSLLAYTLVHANGSFFLSALENVCVPLELARCDLLFLHHILEIVYYFVPVGASSHGVLDLLAFLYDSEPMLISRRFKKFFIVKLLMVLGVMPDVDKAVCDVIDVMSGIRIDQFNDGSMNDEEEKKVDIWLWYCMWQHPYVQKFKTVCFLEKYRMT